MILIVFGSKSDAKVYHEIALNLKKHGQEYEIHVCSAHRTPKKLEMLLQRKWKLIIAGAGLAAHLPGVCASLTLTPIIGVPTIVQFDGLDAFLAVVQMPAGISVLATSPNNSKSASDATLLLGRNHIELCGLLNTKAAKKAMSTLNELGIPYSISPIKNSLKIHFIHLGEKPSEFGIYCQVSEETHTNDAMKFLESAQNGLFVGINRGDNAALSAAQMLGEFDKISKYRETQRQKVEAEDLEESKCLHQI